MTNAAEGLGWVDPAHAHKLAHALVEDLCAQGDLQSPEWRRAFECVPRHVLMPRFYRRVAPETWRLMDGTDQDSRDEWLSLIYTDDAWPTQRPDPAVGVGASSGTMPSLMALMLEALDVREGNRVLEIGTGTGYNAALLAERLGSAAVTTVDVDPDVVGLARARLAATGYTPTLAVADGAQGHPAGAPFDRVIATCSVTRVPLPWVAQTSPGGRLLIPFRGRLDGGLLLLTAAEDGSASGRFLTDPAYFMPLRSPTQPTWPPNAPALQAARTDPGSGRPTPLLTSLFEDFPFRFFLQFAAPSLQLSRSTSPGPRGHELYVYDAFDRSWARISEKGEGARRTLEHDGPRDVGQDLERAYSQWRQSGRPARERFTMQITSDGRHQVGIDGTDRHWTLNNPDERQTSSADPIQIR